MGDFHYRSMVARAQMRHEIEGAWTGEHILLGQYK